MNSITTYDCTLRDGEQGLGIALSLEDKLRIVERLDAFGIDIVEGGYPASNPRDIEFFKRVAGMRLRHARIAAFGSTCRKGLAASQDAGIAALLESGAPVVTLVGKAHAGHVEAVLRTTLEENLRMVAESVAYCVAAGREVVLDAEHFFDGYAANSDYALAVVCVAAEAGASCVCLCETNGGALPDQVAQATAAAHRALGLGPAPGVAGAFGQEGEVRSARASSEPSGDVLRTDELPVQAAGSAPSGASRQVALGIHCHNDSGCAVANSLAAVQAGATHVQGTINGYGERAGNADLLSVIANVELKLGLSCSPDLSQLTSTANYVAECCNASLPANTPYTGSAVFAHKGGLHASALSRMEGAYEHVDPAAVGNQSNVVVSELAGKASLVQKAAQLGIDLPADEALVQRILDDVKAREADGYTYEVADGSLYLLMLRHLGKLESHFTLESFRVIVDDREDMGSWAKDAASEATIKIRVGSVRTVATGEGAGPVGALDNALRMAIEESYPQVANMELTDFKVRLLDENVGTDAITRVLITTSDGESTWGTVGVSENIIEASWNALVDSIEYGLHRMEWPSGSGAMTKRGRRE
ncbi:MAG: citramalate synthase [Eggerthellaceae bacterium]|nr:citramalate synthase [Eggerthellaceae bacterium]